MQTWSKKAAAVQHCGILLFEGFSVHCLANTVEPLRAANTLSGRTLYQWEFLTLTGYPATSSSGMQVRPHQKLTDASGDLLIVMPSYGFQTHCTWPTKSALRSANQRFRTLAGFDTGSWLLADAGLLSGRRATIHWQELTSFSERFPETDAQRERFIIDGDRITCSGAMAAYDLVLALLARDHGQALALEVGQLFMSLDATTSGPIPRGPSRTLINRAIDLMREHVEHPLPISEVARRSGCTQKTLGSRMRVALGASPQQIYRRTRLIVARSLVLESNLSIVEISLRCGYRDPSAMTRAFRTEFNTTPSAVRTGRS